MLLLTEPWMPIRRRNGERDWIAPHQLSDPDVLAFDADRPDFNGALAQFAIGLLQTTTPVDNALDWKRLLAAPPDSPTLQAWFAPLAEVFHFDGDGARFMQDRHLDPQECTANPVSALLIESPGENSLRNNSDHFVQRGLVDVMCPHCAATALFTLQTNAPAGGVGYRTGLRGGGPLTTLVWGGGERSLWWSLWVNVQERSSFLARCGSAELTLPHLRFPWLADIGAIQGKSGETAPTQVHPDHIFWAMPRRIRLDLDDVAAGECDICGRQSERLIKRFITRNYGLNYKGAWDHPLSPYYETKEAWLPLHPQPGGLGYRHWLAWVLGVDADKQRPARVVTRAFALLRSSPLGDGLRIWAFGYDMDNMKARCWYESLLPLYGLPECDPRAQKAVQTAVGEWLAGAKLAVAYLRSAVKDAWFSGDARGDFSAIDAAFWGATEGAFYRQLKGLVEETRSQGFPADDLATRQAWHGVLVGTAKHLFDQEIVGAGPVEREKPRRIAEAFRLLVRSLDGPKMRQALRLPALEKAKSKTQAPAATAA